MFEVAPQMIDLTIKKLYNRACQSIAPASMEAENPKMSDTLRQQKTSFPNLNLNARRFVND